MGFYLLLGALGIALMALAGCQTMAELAQFLAPIVSDSIALSLSTTIGDAINQGASGNPMGPEEVAALRDGIVGAINGALDASHQATVAAIQDGQTANAWNVFVAGLGGSITGGASVGGASYVGRRNGTIATPKGKSG